MEEVTVEAARGDIDPTLRLDLLQRLKTVKFTAGNRNLFQAGAVITPQMAAAKPVKIMPGPLPRPGINPATGQPIGPLPLGSPVGDEHAGHGQILRGSMARRPRPRPDPTWIGGTPA